MCPVDGHVSALMPADGFSSPRFKYHIHHRCFIHRLHLRARRNPRTSRAPPYSPIPQWRATSARLLSPTALGVFGYSSRRRVRSGRRSTPCGRHACGRHRDGSLASASYRCHPFRSRQPDGRPSTTTTGWRSRRMSATTHCGT
jgi:hypothetical protein